MCTQEHIYGFIVLEEQGPGYPPIVRSVVCPSYESAMSELIRIAQYTSNALSVVKAVTVACYQKDH
jgi:hypothetical protein